MGIDILALYQEHPNAVLTVKASDIVNASREILRETIQELEETHRKQSLEDSIGLEEVSRILGISRSTLDRWSLPGPDGEPPYLPRFKAGVSVRYNIEDINRIREREEAKRNEK